jgi:predicted nucleotidyltransferase
MNKTFDPTVTVIRKGDVPQGLSIHWLSWARRANGRILPITFENTRLRTDRGRTSVGIALLYDSTRPIGALYSGIGTDVSRGETVDWSDIARRALEHVQLHQDHRTEFAQFLAAHAGPALEQFGDFDYGKTGCWDSTIVRLRGRTWEAPVFDLSTGRITRDLRDFSAVRLVESPARLTTAARVRLDYTLEAVGPEQVAEEVRLIIAPHATAAVAWPPIRIGQEMIEVDRTISLEDVFRIRSACGDNLPSDFDLEQVATVLAPSWHQSSDKYLALLKRHLAALEKKWLETRSRAKRRAGKLVLSPVYGGTRIPNGASFGGYDAASVKRVLRTRLDDMAEHKVETLSAKNDERPRVTEGDQLGVSPEMLLTLQRLGIAELNSAPGSNDWKPTKLGRAIASASKSRYRRATAAQAIQGVLTRGIDINRDPECLYRVEKLVLFGSYLRKEAMVGDVDVGVVWAPAIADVEEFRRRRKERDEEINRAAQYRFHWWMHIDLSLREVQNRLRGPSPIIQLSDWDQINSSIRERERSIVLIDASSLVPNADAVLRELELP